MSAAGLKQDRPSLCPLCPLCPRPGLSPTGERNQQSQRFSVCPRGDGASRAGARVSGGCGWRPVGTRVTLPGSPLPDLTPGQVQELPAPLGTPPPATLVHATSRHLAVVTWVLAKGTSKNRQCCGMPNLGRGWSPGGPDPEPRWARAPLPSLGLAVTGAVPRPRGPPGPEGWCPHLGPPPGSGARPPQAVGTALALDQLSGHFAGASPRSPCLGVPF